MSRKRRRYGAMTSPFKRRGRRRFFIKGVKRYKRRR